MAHGVEDQPERFTRAGEKTILVTMMPSHGAWLRKTWIGSSKLTNGLPNESRSERKAKRRITQAPSSRIIHAPTQSLVRYSAQSRQSPLEEGARYCNLCDKYWKPRGGKCLSVNDGCEGSLNNHIQNCRRTLLSHIFQYTYELPLGCGKILAPPSMVIFQRDVIMEHRMRHGTKSPDIPETPKT